MRNKGIDQREGYVIVGEILMMKEGCVVVEKILGQKKEQSLKKYLGGYGVYTKKKEKCVVAGEIL